jgi:hypothetical protein
MTSIKAVVFPINFKNVDGTVRSIMHCIYKNPGSNTMSQSYHLCNIINCTHGVGGVSDCH